MAMTSEGKIELHVARDAPASVLYHRNKKPPTAVSFEMTGMLAADKANSDRLATECATSS